MKKLIVRIVRIIFIRIIGKKHMEKVILYLSRLSDIELLDLAYRDLGILKYQDIFVSGEHFFVANVLKKRIVRKSPILFDVGANIGDYSRELRAAFPDASIYAFEPNCNTFDKLRKEAALLNIHCFSFGFGSRDGETVLYTYPDDKCSGHASVYKNILSDLRKAASPTEMDFKITTIDKFCAGQNISFIDFLKIDVEGHELEVLKGADFMITNNRIGVIQFEFNDCNIISRVFLKDFYEILKGYKIYRLDTNRLIPLFEYDSTNEIFKIQNFVAFGNI